MKKILMATAIAGLATLFTVGMPSPASADNFRFSFNTGDVAVAYSDGYYDHNRRWHRWNNAREHREYRARYHDRYHDGRRDRHPNRGWRDRDRDGIPNRYDRDRDNDGVPNRWDARPNNPWRD